MPNYIKNYLKTKEDVIKALQNDCTVFEDRDNKLYSSYSMYNNIDEFINSKKGKVLIRTKYPNENNIGGLIHIGDSANIRFNTKSKYYTVTIGG